MRFGIQLIPEDRWELARHRWRLAEQMGFDHAWTYDHLNWRWFRAREWYTVVPTLAAAAVETSRIGLGVLVASPNLRHPVHLAKDVTTLDDISAGRLILGLGAGATGFDATMTRRVPWTRRERTRRFAEYLELTDRLLTRPVTSFEGRHYVAREVHCHPSCRQQPRVPFAIAAAGPRGMRLTARYGQYWVTPGDPNSFEVAPYQDVLPTVRRQLAALDEACAETGRDPGTLARLAIAGPTMGGVLASREAFLDAAGRLGELGITDLVVQWPRAEEPYRGEEKVLDEIAGVLA